MTNLAFGLLLALGAFLVGDAAVAPQSKPGPFLKGPYLQAPGARTMTVMWESATNRPGVVRYGLKHRRDETFRLDRPSPMFAVTNYSVTNLTADLKTNVSKISLTNVVYLYEVTLTNLQSNALYTYTAETDGALTSPRRFKTFGAHPDRVRFVAYGDTRTNPKTHAALAATFKRYTPDFILHLGDLVGDGKRYELWGKEFFEPLARVIDEVPILPAIGNHEEDGTNYLRYVHLPAQERWYSYDVGPVHLLALDFHYEKATDAQFAFARQDLENSHAPWKVVMLHYPVFNIGGHATTWGHTNYLPLFHSTHVDLVLAGHSHLYERFKPLAPAEETNRWPILFITTGGGGAPLTTTRAHPALAASFATNHFVLIDATPQRLKGLAIGVNNGILDQFELIKRDGKLSPSYAAGAYPEEALRLSYEVAASLGGTTTALPKTNEVVDVEWTFHPLRWSEKPVSIAIDLTANSALYYKLANGTVLATAPSMTESNWVVSAPLVATGRKAVTAEGKEKELSPPLAFQAQLVRAGVATIAYGPNSKVKLAIAESTAKAAVSP